MTKATIYHNPRCSKSRACLQLLEDQTDLEIEIIEYLNNPPSEQTLRDLIKRLNIPVIDLIRKNEQPFKELALAGEDDDTLIQAMQMHPILIQRPIIVIDDRAVIGRPPENVLSLLD